MTRPEAGSPPAVSRTNALLQLVAVLGLAAVFLSMMSAYETVDAGALPEAFLIGRMAVLVLLCTWLLRRSGERWGDPVPVRR